MNRRFVPVITIAMLVGAACGGGSDDAASSPAAADDASEAVTDAPADDSSDSDESADSGLVADLPQFLSDFERVCTTETGFAGATPYSDGPGPHPFVLLVESDSGSMFDRTISDAPPGWAIETDLDFDDNSEFVATELIACATQSSAEPTGIMCDLELDDDSVVTLELVDVTMDLTIREATTGNVVGTETLDGSDAECPFFALINDGDTQHMNTPTDDDYISALKPYVAP
ncbi:hypothetical protein [Ilumatobacter coccineus]|uniref:Lipoprotein n=1 Tax=Ilumatobacter coccineus (strain NBRC 103263 / KCTC 29153 / YM16-304) TaxID=1313172 RepID=A0A6C7E826_ILUCY|nr:hypothetical protein [Ilumatobacter coccineus]BAN03814.1 hypothetical protein YM304_35000 [Ilumatobacter coccineus YM16-304]